jgi:molecular chaperone GrpE
MVKKKSKTKSKNVTSDLKSQLARALADYDNLQKRTEKERDLFKTFAKVEVIDRILPVLDMLEEAQQHLKDKGLAIALNSFQNVLKTEGLQRINSDAGEMFDEDLHDAVDIVEKKGKNGEIVEEILSGYKIDDVLIRPAKVRVIRNN